MAIKRVIIYTGHCVQGVLRGPYLAGVHEDKKLFQLFAERFHKNWCVEGADSTNLARILSLRRFSKILVVLPAGPASNYDLMPEETKQLLKTQLSQGWIDLIATCGATYALAQQRLWRGFSKEGQFGIFSGRAAGPLYVDPSQPFGTDFVFKVCTLKVGVGRINVVLGGGGSLFYEEDGQTDTLASYKEEDLQALGLGPSWENAIVVHRHGKGAAVLSMVHPGIGAEDMLSLKESMQSLFPSRHLDDWNLMAEKVSSLEERLFLVNSMVEQLEKT